MARRCTAILGALITFLAAGRRAWLDVFLNIGGYLAYNFYRTTQWGGWTLTDIPMSSAPAPAAFPDGHIDVFYQASDRSIRQITCTCWTG